MPPVRSVRPSGKKATDQTGSPGPHQGAFELARGALDDRDRATDAGGGDPPAVGGACHGNDRRRPRRDLADENAGSRDQIDLAVGAGGDDLAVRGDRDRIERRRHRDGDGRSLAVQRCDAQRRVVAGADERAAIRREGDAIDVLPVAGEHARRTAGERPQPRRAIPGGRGQQRPVGRDRQGDHRGLMALEHRRRLRLAPLPDRNARVLAAGRDTAISQEDHGVDGTVVEPQHLLGFVVLQRPADHRAVEAAGDCACAVRRDCKRSHRPAVTAQLSMRRVEKNGGAADDQANQQHGSPVEANGSAQSTIR